MDCIIPAAGASRRMGTPKQNTVLDGRPMLEIVVDHAARVCSRCIVVTGANRDAARSVIPVRPDVEEVYNPNHEAGMISSIAVGAALVRTPWFFVAPGDMPRLSPNVFTTLMREAERHDSDKGPAALFPVYQGRRGHPVLISRRVIPELLQRVRWYRSMRDFLGRYDSLDVAVFDAGIHLDVDTPADVRSAEDAGRKRDE